MSWELWTAYAIATTILLLVPGPTVLLVVGYAISGGRRTAWWTVPGVALGDAVAITASLAGLGAAMAASAALFGILKWIGAAYLVYLGVRLWRSERPGGPIDPGIAPEKWSLTAHAFAVTALNPKSIAFFVAFLPQFVTPQSPLAPQLFILGATFLVLAFINIVLYAVLAGSVRERLRQPRLFRILNRAGGALLIGAGVLTAALRRS